MVVKVTFTAINDMVYNAEVTEVAPALDPNTSTYPVRVTITDSDERIKSGMAANVNFEFVDETINARQLVVPASGVGEDGNGRFVFLIEGEDNNYKEKKQPITIGDLTAEGFEVKSGLAYGQKIVTAGLQTLLDGQQVKL